ncbi:GntR family transcriptional regulator [Curtobacterium citreum]
MPVPKSAPANGPRTLLRDVVYKQMLDAIEDGTLTPGERLNDDELTGWLGVSRTPVREAIARLASEGLVEMAPNRYTRVASQSSNAFREAAELADALYSHALVQADRINASTRASLRKRGAALQTRIAAHDVDAYRDLQDILGAATAAIGNQLMTETEHAVRGRVKFHAPADESDIAWDAAAVRLEAITAL